MGWVLAACGAFTICVAAFDWKFFMNHWNAQFLVRLFGRTGTRILYGILGASLVALGLLMAMGIIQDSK